ncbi:MAG: NAD-dependent epimerase/dehydratase family protein [Bryobacteraceae bacterium]|jgi:UDP-2-acetamido-2,6-beta-L-arabino-hexul-4-ose reductase
MNALITGAKGFIGRNLVSRLRAQGGCYLRLFDLGSAASELREALSQADIVYHLAGVNRPQDPEEFAAVNTGLTRDICDILRGQGRTPRIVLSSSTQAAIENSYGVSKRKAEEALEAFAAETGAVVRIYRLANVFGKWSRPNYNSVVASFCHNIANDLPIAISDHSRKVELVYIDDVVDAFVAELTGENGAVPKLPTCMITLGDLAGRIQALHEMHTSLLAPDFSIRFNQQLFATFLSYVPDECRRQQLHIRADERGCFAEFIKSPHFGQISISKTKPGVTRGNHYHHTKTEKFFVVQGEGIIRMRHIEGSRVTEYRVCGAGFQVIDIPPGFTHSIENVGSGELVTLFWASEIFEPDRPDTYHMPVLPPAEAGERVTA